MTALAEVTVTAQRLPTDGLSIGGGADIGSSGPSALGGTASTLRGSAPSGSSSSAGIVLPAILAGRAFQSSFNGTFNVASNTTRLFTNIGNTIPDLYEGGVGLLELKNGAYIYNTPQIARQLAFALDAKVPLYLGVSPTGTIARTTLAEVAETGGQAFIYDAEAGTIAGYEGEELSQSLLEFLGLLAVED